MKYDLIVVGAGPGGYVAAERAAAAGQRVLLIEKAHLGGVCLNVGCIPSKTLLNSAKCFHHARHAEVFGVTIENVSFDWNRAMARKQKVIETLRNGIAGLMKKFKIDVVNGAATLRAGRKVEVNGQVHEADNILLCTGSSPARPPIPGADLPGVVDSTGILSLEKKPSSVVVIGGGVIGCEFACFFGSLGVPVTVIEMLPEICPQVDAEIAKILRTELAKKNITFHTAAKVLEITPDAVRFEKDGKTETVARDVVLMSTGRTPNVQGLGLEEARVDFDKRGIKVDDRCATNVPGIWAAGDCTGRAWLAHTATRMGEVAVHNMLGRADRYRSNAIPGVVYTSPEVASIGWSEDDAKKNGTPVRVAKIPMGASGRYLAETDGERGQVKAVVHAETNVILGIHMIGGACSEIIWGAAALIESEFRVKEVEELVFPHPTVSELIRDSLFTLH